LNSRICHVCIGRTKESATAALRRKELFDENKGAVRIFFGEEVAALHRLSLRAWSSLPPNAQRTSVLCIESVEWSALSPEMQHRAFDPLASFFVGAIVFDIDRGRSAIFFADAVNASGIAVGWEHARGQR
jgi:hypothetical protein